jgi:hypothetical protein
VQVQLGAPVDELQHTKVELDQGRKRAVRLGDDPHFVRSGADVEERVPILVDYLSGEVE